uniref:Globin domain-containing protein n=1 Tax=Acrobeloides nanus TaxID=290746 RepID=A0A914BWJ3_9BILA
MLSSEKPILAHCQFGSAITARRAIHRPKKECDWHSASCRVPTKYNHSNNCFPTGPVPQIEIHYYKEKEDRGRRTSIVAPLRFVRTVSSDSIDSLERQCLKDLRRQRLMEEIEFYSNEQESHLCPSASNNNPNLKKVGRSRTDPGENGTPTTTPPPPRCISPIDGATRIKYLDTNLKKSTPDLTSDVKSRALRDIIGLSVYQQRLINQCWPNIYSTGTSGSFASNLYQKLCNKNQKAKSLMQKADGVAVFSQSDTDCTSMHMKLTLELIDTIVRNLDSNPTNLINYLIEIGQSHRSLKDEGMNVSMWDDFGDAILEGVRRNDMVRKHKELRRAWLAIIAFLTDHIKQGLSTFRVSPSMENNDFRQNSQ